MNKHDEEGPRVIYAQVVDSDGMEESEVDEGAEDEINE
jgi:hypothetical protein